jgi:uncharacterized membrane protein
MDVNHTVELIGSAFELAGVGVLAIGSVIAFARFFVSLIRLRSSSVAYRHLRLSLGRSIMVGLELLIAADIIVSTRMNCQTRTSFEMSSGWNCPFYRPEYQ